jgi:hypothetical protein
MKSGTRKGHLILKAFSEGHYAQIFTLLKLVCRKLPLLSVINNITIMRVTLIINIYN